MKVKIGIGIIFLIYSIYVYKNYIKINEIINQNDDIEFINSISPIPCFLKENKAELDKIMPSINSLLEDYNQITVKSFAKNSEKIWTDFLELEKPLEEITPIISELEDLVDEITPYNKASENLKTNIENIISSFALTIRSANRLIDGINSESYLIISTNVPYFIKGVTGVNKFKNSVDKKMEEMVDDSKSILKVFEEISTNQYILSSLTNIQNLNEGIQNQFSKKAFFGKDITHYLIILSIRNNLNSFKCLEVNTLSFSKALLEFSTAPKKGVTSKNANFRPHCEFKSEKDYPIIQKGKQVTIIEKCTNGYKVELNGQIGYVHENLIKIESLLFDIE